MKIFERERVCLDLLGKLPDKYVLVGGYATSSFEFPRFSVDLDLVIREKDVPEFSGIFKGEGFRFVKKAGEFGKFYKGKMLRFEKKVGALPVSVDLLVDMIQSRQTEAVYSFDYFWKNSELRKVMGSGERDTVEARVANREMLIALRINSMRMADQRDIIALCNARINTGQVISHLKRAPRDKILNHLDILAATLANPDSKDSIKGVFGIPDRAYERMIGNAKKEISAIKYGISGGKEAES